MATPFEPIPVNQIASISTVGYTSSIYLLVSFLCALGITFSVGIDLIVIAIKTTLSMSFKGGYSTYPNNIIIFFFILKYFD